MTVTTSTTQKTLSKTVGGKTVSMTPEQAEAFGRELDSLKERVSRTWVSATPPTSGESSRRNAL
jgi:hypothetical protein